MAKKEMENKIRRRSFIKTSSAFTLGLGAFQAGCASLVKPATSRKLPYRVIYDDDTWQLFGRIEEPFEPGYIDRWIGDVVDGGADLYLQCINYNRIFYPGKIWDTWWGEYRRQGTWLGMEPQPGFPHPKYMVQLEDMGIDFLERVLKICRQLGVASGITVRMNDRHYPGPRVGEYSENEYVSRFYQDTDMYLSGPSAERYHGQWALNYDRPEVREHYLSLIREVVENYEFDVLNLDYVRAAPFFDRDNIERHNETMTGFLREVNKITKASGRDISIIARVPATPANCYGVGLDVGTWAAEGLVSGIAMGMQNCTGWENPADAFRHLVGDNVSIYGATERQAGRTALVHVKGEGENRTSATPWSREMFRGFASGHLANGADGIYLFNFFLGNLPIIDILAEMRSLEGLRGKPKVYRMATFGHAHAVEVDLPMQVPVHVPAMNARRFGMLMSAEPDGTLMEAQVLLDRKAEPDKLWLQLNDVQAGHAVMVSDKPVREKYYSWWNILDTTSTAVFSLPVRAFRDGRNHIVFRNESGIPVTVLGIAIYTI